MSVCNSNMKKVMQEDKIFKIVYYKHVVIINHNRCDTVHLGSLVNIGNARNLGTTIIIFKN